VPGRPRIVIGNLGPGAFLIFLNEMASNLCNFVKIWQLLNKIKSKTNLINNIFIGASLQFVVVEKLIGNL